MVVQLSFVFYVSANRNLSAKQVEQVFESNPQLLVGYAMSCGTRCCFYFCT